MLDLLNAVVIGFFSLPSPSLAESNPEAYSAAMCDLPANAGSCAHCGTGILRHVILRLVDGSRAFIGTSCAEKVGSERVRSCVRERLTDEQLVERERKADIQRAESDALVAQVAAERAARYELFRDIIDPLRAQGTEFHASLAAQLLDGSLSDRQTNYVLKVLFGRYSKRVATQWDAVYCRCTGMSPEEYAA